MTELTASQLKTFNFIDGFIKAHQAAPTLREITAGLGWKSTRAAGFHMESLERLGYIARDRSLGQTSRIARLVRILKRPEVKFSTRKRAA
jgi:SOS-response transcriptional repressor LexA